MPTVRNAFKARLLLSTLILLVLQPRPGFADSAAQAGRGFGQGNDTAAGAAPEQAYPPGPSNAMSSRTTAAPVAPSRATHVLNTFTVSTAADTGAGSLRAAIASANASPGLDLIRFAIGSGVVTISPASQLPDLTDPVIIDGSTQSGYAGTPLIELSGALAGANAIGLVVKGGLSKVRALCINRWATTGSGGFGIVLDGASGDSVLGCYLGTDPSGTIARPNAVNGLLINGTSTFNAIGGLGTNDRNVISGNTSSGIQIAAGNGGFNSIVGNLIGLKANGAATLANGGNGIFLDSSDNRIGGELPGAGNVISGNSFPGVFIGLDSRRTVVEGNFIGTDITGMIDLGNVQNGVYVDRARDNVIGDSSGVWRNVISGNEFPAVYLFGAAATGNFVEGNFLCLDRAGTGALGDGNGVVIDGASGNMIGGNSPFKRNVIGGTPNNGISMINGATGNWIRGNYIGTDSSGTFAVPCLKGVLANNTPGNFIGGTGAGQGNVISGNTSFGVELRNAGATSNRVLGNYIGVGKNGSTPLGNGAHGICISSSTDTVAFDNVIAYNFGAGVYDSAGTGNVIRRNRIHHNAGLGIDLKPPGITPNDTLDADAGVNDLSNFPVLDSASVHNGRTYIFGRMTGKPNRRYLIDYFSSDSADASHFGEGQLLEVSRAITTDAAGIADIEDSLDTEVSLTRFLSATATDSLSGTTSEFSQALCLNDADGDGLWDSWETQGWGIDVNSDGVVDLDLYARGARPDHKDLFVELDAMQGHKPPPTAIPMVIAAFAQVPNIYVHNPDGQPGIALHAALDDSTVAEKALPVMWKDFMALKDSTFGTKAERMSSNARWILKSKQLAYRYGMWIRTFCTGDDTLHGGVAEIDGNLGGNDFVVAFGSTGACGYNNPTDPRIHAGAFMHEFGHTLGLQHGGIDGVNMKQNYYSIMNYLWAKPRKWHAPKAWRLDYSPIALPTLVEQHLNENNGLGAPAGVWPIVTIPYMDNYFTRRQARLEPGAKVDWSGDGAFQSDIEGDINIVDFGYVDCSNDTDYTLSPRDTLRGYADWQHIAYNLRNSFYFDSVDVRCPQPHLRPTYAGARTAAAGSVDELTALEDQAIDALPPPRPSGRYVMDGALDPSARPISASGGLTLYADYRSGQLYLAANAAPSQGGDLVLFVSDARGNLRSAPLAKAGQAAAWTAYVDNRSADNSSEWADGSGAPLTSVTVDSSGTFMEGVVDVGLLFGTYPGHLYIGLAKYASTTGGALLAQVPPGNGDGNFDGTELYDLVVPTAVPSRAPDGGVRLSLSPIRPNPVLGQAHVELTLGEAAWLEAEVQDVLGRRVATLHHGPMPAGVHTLSWDPVTDQGHRQPPGVYFLVVRALGRQATTRLVLLR